MKQLLALVLAVLAPTGESLAAPNGAASTSFQGRVYQVDTIRNNVDVIMPDRKRTLWADGVTQVRVRGGRAQLIDIAMGDRVSGTYRSGAHGELVLVRIEDLGGE